MLGRKDYTKEEFNQAKAAIDHQVAAYRKLAKATAASGDAKARSALQAFEPLLFNSMVLTLDRFFVHRLRMVTGKDGTPLNEVELLSDSLMNKEGVFTGNNAIKFIPGDSVLKLNFGERITLSADDFERLADAFFAELQAKYL